MNLLFVIRYLLWGRWGRMRLLSGTNDPVSICNIRRVAAGLIFFALTVISSAAEEGAAAGPAEPVDLKPNRIQALEQRLATITDPVAKLFFTAGLEHTKGDSERAIETLAQLIVEHPNDEKWIAKSELLSAELYLELGMLKSAAATARQVLSLHAGTDAAKQAAELRVKIEKLRKETESKESSE